MRSEKSFFTSTTVTVISFVVFVVVVAAIVIQYRPPAHIRAPLGLSNNTSVLVFNAAKTTPISQPYRVEVAMDSEGNQVNAVGLYLRYDPGALQLTNMDTSASFCQFYPEKRFDNNLGTISLACGSPHPGVVGTSVLVVLEFLPLKLGTTKLFVQPESEILKSDGKGTNLLDDFPQHEVTILNTI